jgi:hypothetical protein
MFEKVAAAGRLVRGVGAASLKRANASRSVRRSACFREPTSSMRIKKLQLCANAAARNGFQRLRSTRS